VKRGSFKLSSSHVLVENSTYHDEWITGGGQELIRTSAVSYDRVYVGDTISEKKL